MELIIYLVTEFQPIAIYSFLKNSSKKNPFLALIIQKLVSSAMVGMLNNDWLVFIFFTPCLLCQTDSARSADCLFSSDFTPKIGSSITSLIVINIFLPTWAMLELLEEFYLHKCPYSLFWYQCHSNLKKFCSIAVKLSPLNNNKLFLEQDHLYFYGQAYHMF